VCECPVVYIQSDKNSNKNIFVITTSPTRSLSFGFARTLAVKMQ